MITRKDKNVQFSEYAGHLSNQVNNTDILRAESLQRLHKIRSKRKNNQQRQLQHLVAKLGDKHPRVLKQAERIVHEKEMENYLSIAISRAEIETKIIKDSFSLKGRILADNVKGVSGYIVQLQDATNKVIGEPVKTDAGGNYSIVVNVKKGEKPKNLKLVILDKQGALIHKDKHPILLRANVVDLRDVIISKIDKLDRSKETVLKNVMKANSLKPKVVKSKAKKPSVPKTKKTTKKPVKKRIIRKTANKKSNK